MRLYDSPFSGHAHRARVFLHILGLSFETTVLNLGAGEHKSDAFRSLNPLMQVPVLVDDDAVIRDSTAILVYLAQRYDPARTWLPVDATAAAQVQSWLSVASRELFVGPCVARLVKLFNAPFDHDAAVASTTHVLSALFEPHLADRTWLVGDAPTIADLACYGYLAAAHEGAFDLEPYPNVRAWLERVEAIPGFVAMPAAADLMAAS
ncbi:MAG: glutathione S-transferase [Myxococcota bacterium]